jgi:osmotically-inducible protein OsmY
MKKTNSLFATLGVMLLTPLLMIGCAQPSSHAGREDGNDDGSVGQGIDDAMITARIKTTYLFNRHLNSFKIDVDTKGGVVSLEGTVKSDIQRDLAEEIASNVDGVTMVNSRLELSDGPVSEPDETDRTFSQAVIDATTTASIKMKLAVAEGVKAHDINVDTRWGTVTLTGVVGSAAEKELATKIAHDVDRVKEVENRLEIRS